MASDRQARVGRLFVAALACLASLSCTSSASGPSDAGEPVDLAIRDPAEDSAASRMALAFAQAHTEDVLSREGGEDDWNHRLAISEPEILGIAYIDEERYGVIGMGGTNPDGETVYALVRFTLVGEQPRWDGATFGCDGEGGMVFSLRIPSGTGITVALDAAQDATLDRGSIRIRGGVRMQAWIDPTAPEHVDVIRLREQGHGPIC